MEKNSYYTQVFYVNGTSSEFYVRGTLYAEEINLGGRAEGEWNTTVKAINVSYQVNTIAEGAFWYLSALEEIQFSDNIVKLDGTIINNCPKLKSFQIPESVTSISKSGNTVINCDGLTSLDYRDFELSSINPYSCKNLESISCQNLTAIDVRNIFMYDAFDCPKLQSICVNNDILSSSNNDLTVIRSSDNSLLFTVPMAKAISVDSQYIDSFALFYAKDNLQSIYAPNLSSIDFYDHYPNLTSFYVNNSYLSSCPNGYGCDDTLVIRLSDECLVFTCQVSAIDTDVKNILNNNYVLNSALKYLKIDHVTDIGYQIFENTVSLKYIHAALLSSLEAINGCHNLEGMYVPNMTSINWDYYNYVDYKLKAFDMSYVEYIGKNTFCNIDSIATISSNSITAIGDAAFMAGDTSSLLNTVILPNVKMLNGEYGEFRGCYNLRHVLLDTIECLGENTFLNCYNLYRIDLPDSVLCVGINGYNDRTGIVQKLLMLSSVTHVPTLINSRNLQSDDLSIVVVDEHKSDFIAQWSSLSGNIYSMSEYSANLDHRANPGADTSYVELWDGQLFDIDSSSNMHSQAFNHNDVVKIYFGSDLTSFTGSIDLSGIGSDRFERLRTIEFSDAAEFSDTAKICFKGCISLLSIDLSQFQSFNIIADNCFMNCTSLLYAKTPNIVDSDIINLFSGCISLKEVDIGSSTTCIGNCWFKDCVNLTSILNYMQYEASWIGESAFENCISFKNENYAILQINEIQPYAFKDCINIDNILLTNTNDIQSYAFDNCWNLQSIDVYKDNINISLYAFNNCYRLGEYLYLNYATIDANAFVNCTNLHYVTLDNTVSICTTPAGDVGDSFAGKMNVKELHIEGNDSIFATQNIAPGGIENSCENIYICNMTNIAMDLAHGKENTAIKHAYIGPELTAIGNTSELGGWGPTFQGCVALEGISFTDVNNIVYLTNGAFERCRSLTSFSGTLVESVGSYAFKDCSSLQSVLLKADCYLDTSSFENCSSLNTVVALNLHLCNTSAGEDIFKNCISLESIQTSWNDDSGYYVFNGNSHIADGTFANCSSLTTELYFPDMDSFIYIDYGSTTGAFLNCKSLTKISLSSGIFEEHYSNMFYNGIPPSTFAGCIELTCCEIPHALSIGEYAFAGCEKLKNLFIQDVNNMNLYAVKHIESNAFASCYALNNVNARWCAYVGPSAFIDCHGLQNVNLPFYDISGKYHLYIDDYAFANCSSLNDVWSPYARYIGNKAFENHKLECALNYDSNGYLNIKDDAYQTTNDKPDWIQFRTENGVTFNDLKSTSLSLYGFDNSSYIIASKWPKNGDGTYDIEDVKLGRAVYETELKAENEKYCTVSAWMHLGIDAYAIPYLSALFLENPRVSADYIDYIRYLYLCEIIDANDLPTGITLPYKTLGHDAEMWKYVPNHVPIYKCIAKYFRLHDCSGDKSIIAYVVGEENDSVGSLAGRKVYDSVNDIINDTPNESLKLKYSTELANLYLCEELIAVDDEQNEYKKDINITYVWPEYNEYWDYTNVDRYGLNGVYTKKFGLLYDKYDVPEKFKSLLATSLTEPMTTALIQQVDSLRAMLAELNNAEMPTEEPELTDEEKQRIDVIDNMLSQYIEYNLKAK